MAGRTNGFSHGERPHRTLSQGRGGLALDPPADGPYDGDDPDLDTGEDGDRVDFGAVRVPVPDRGTVTVEPTANGRMQAVHIALPEGRLSVSALAAPKSSVLWPELAKEIATSLRDGGARVRSFTGAWGRELHATTGSATSVFIGVDGPRWMLYGVAAGPTADAVALDAELRRMLCRTVVVRGRSPYPVRTVLPLVAPDDLVPEQLTDPSADSAPTEVRLVGRAAAPAVTPEPAGSSAPTDPWRRDGAPTRGAPGRAAPARPAEPGPAVSRPAAPRPAGSRPAASRPAESRPGGSRPAASQPAAPRPATSRPAAAAPDPLADPLPDPLSDGTPTERWHLIPARPVAPRAPGHLPPAGAGPAELSSPAAGRTRPTPASGTGLAGTPLAGARPATEPRTGRRRAAEPVEDLPVQPRTGRRRAPEPVGSEPVPVSQILARAAAEAASRPARRRRAAGPAATGPAASSGFPVAALPVTSGPGGTAEPVATSGVATPGVAAAGPAIPRTGRRRAPERGVPELGIPELEIPQPEIPARAVPAWGPPEPEPPTAPLEVPGRDAGPSRRSRHAAGSDLPAVEPSPPPRGRHHRPG